MVESILNAKEWNNKEKWMDESKQKKTTRKNSWWILLKNNKKKHSLDCIFSTPFYRLTVQVRLFIKQHVCSWICIFFSSFLLLAHELVRCIRIAKILVDLTLAFRFVSSHSLVRRWHFKGAHHKQTNIFHFYSSDFFYNRMRQFGFSIQHVNVSVEFVFFGNIATPSNFELFKL